MSPVFSIFAEMCGDVKQHFEDSLEKCLRPDADRFVFPEAEPVHARLWTRYEPPQVCVSFACFGKPPYAMASPEPSRDTGAADMPEHGDVSSLADALPEPALPAYPMDALAGASSTPSPPASPMDAIAEALIAALKASPEFYTKFIEAVQPWHNEEMRFGTYCSGTDLCVPAHKAFARALQRATGICIRFTHLFAVEIDQKKQAFIKHFNKDLKYLFSDIQEFGTPSALDVLSGGRVHMAKIAAEMLDFLVGGFSCKDASSLKDRAKHAKWVHDADAKGSTRETGLGMLDMVAALRPLWGMAENVAGLLHKLKDEHGEQQEPHIVPLTRAFADIGYSTAHVLTCARYYGIPVRRKRVYIPQTTHEVQQSEFQKNFESALELLRLPTSVVQLSALLSPKTKRPRTLSPADAARMRTLSADESKAHLFADGADVYFAMQNSASWGMELGVGLVPCLRPNSQIYSNRLGGYLRGREHMALQGVVPGPDFPDYDGLGLSDSFERDLSGNSFNVGQYLANFIAAIAAGTSATDGRAHARTHGRTHGRTDTNHR